MFLEEIGYDNWRAMDVSRLDIPGITYLRDEQIKSMETIRDSDLEREKACRKRLITESLDSGSFGESLGHLLTYHALRGGGGSGGDPGNEPDYFEIITRNRAELDPGPGRSSTETEATLGCRFLRGSHSASRPSTRTSAAPKCMKCVTC